MIRSATNIRGEKIEVDFVVTPLDKEHEYGTGSVEEIVEKAGAHWARMVYDDGSGEDWFGVDELTNVNVAVREKGLAK